MTRTRSAGDNGQAVQSADRGESTTVRGPDLEDTSGDGTDRPESTSELATDISEFANLLSGIDALLALLGRRIQREHVDVAALAEERWHQQPTEDVRLRIDANGGVRADREWLGLALDELFGNAIDHGGPGTTVRVGTDDGRLYVADDGPGLGETDPERAIEPGVTTERTAAGCGLTVVERVAGAHGWDCRLTETDRGGLRVDLFFDS